MTFFGPDLRNGLPIGLGSVAGFGIAPRFSPASLFAAGVNGAWFDPSDSTTLFSDRAGTTPCSTPGGGSVVPVGLMLDKSQGLVLGSELVTNGGPGFTTTTGWTASGATVNTSGGKLVCAVTAAGPSVYWTLTTVIGTWYQVNIVWENVNAINPNILVNSTGGLSITTTNTNATVYFCAVATSTFVQMLLGNGAPGTSTRITSLSAKTIAGNHAIAANDTTARPELRARVNLLLRSEEFENAVWNKTNSTVTANAGVSPDGTTTADLLYPASSGLYRGMYQQPTLAAALYIDSFYVKASGKTWVQVLGLNGAGNTGVWFNLANGTVGTQKAGYTGTIQSVGSGWYRVAVTHPSQSNPYVTINVVDGDDIESVTANGTDGVLIWGAQLTATNEFPANTYQRITDANTYDAVGFPRYFVANGTSSAMSTPGNVNLSGTDKVTVFAGVRKLSDAGTGTVVELSSSAANNGMFDIFAPDSPNEYVYGSRASTTYRNALIDSAAYAAPITNVVTGISDIAAPLVNLRLNGASINSNTASQGTGNFGSYPLFIGARNNSSLFFNGNIYSLIVVGSAVSAGQISATEQWVAGKVGITI